MVAAAEMSVCLGSCCPGTCRATSQGMVSKTTKPWADESARAVDGLGVLRFRCRVDRAGSSDVPGAGRARKNRNWSLSCETVYELHEVSIRGTMAARLGFTYAAFTPLERPTNGTYLS